METTFGNYRSVIGNHRDNADDLFAAVCPRIYRTLDLVRYPSPTQLDEVLKHPSDDLDADENVIADYVPGLLLTGPSGSGKTRAAWKWIQGALANRRSVFTTDGEGWKTLCWNNALEAGAWNDFLDSLTCCDAGGVDTFEVVFFDDLDKGRLTPAAARGLLTVIERRTADQLPIVITTNITGAQLRAKIVADMKAEEDDSKGTQSVADSIVRRLRDASLFKVVKFPNPKP